MAVNRKTGAILAAGVAVLVLGGALLAYTKPWTAFTSVTVDEVAAVEAYRSAPTAEPSPEIPVELAGGSSQSQDHTTSGGATIVRLPGGSLVLTLSELVTDNGPDLHVYLTDNATDAAAGYFVDLGTLKGNQGTQNYDVPLDVDLSRAVYVSIWCEDFAVPFGFATLA
jgi:hypothetical protein